MQSSLLIRWADSKPFHVISKGQGYFQSSFVEKEPMESTLSCRAAETAPASPFCMHSFLLVNRHLLRHHPPPYVHSVLPPSAAFTHHLLYLKTFFFLSLQHSLLLWHLFSTIPPISKFFSYSHDQWLLNPRKRFTVGSLPRQSPLLLLTSGASSFIWKWLLC